MMRAVASVPPPAAHGTINVIGRSGYAANAGVAKTLNASAAATRPRTNTFIMTPPGRELPRAGLRSI